MSSDSLHADQTTFVAGWSGLPADLLLMALTLAGSDSYKQARAACHAWRQTVDQTKWSCAKGDLRNTALGPLPKASCHQLKHVHLYFNGCSNTVSDFCSSTDCSSAFVEGLLRIKLGEMKLSETCSHGQTPQLNDTAAASSAAVASVAGPTQGGTRQHGSSGSISSTNARVSPVQRVLILHFGNYCVHASTVEALLRYADPGLLHAWPMLEVHAVALPSAWPGQSSRAGLVLDGGLRGALVAAGTVVGLQQQGRQAPMVPQVCLAGRQQACCHGSSSSSSGGGAYTELVSCGLPVFRRQLLLLPVPNLWEEEGRRAAARLCQLAPKLKVLRLEGPLVKEGLGLKAGALLRPDLVAFGCMPPLIQEVQFVGAELPRVHYSGSHLKPWEAVLLVDTVDYLLHHFVQPLVNTFPDLCCVRCMGTRVPRGTVIAARPVHLTTQLHTSFSNLSPELQPSWGSYSRRFEQAADGAAAAAPGAPPRANPAAAAAAAAAGASSSSSAAGASAASAGGGLRHARPDHHSTRQHHPYPSAAGAQQVHPPQPVSAGGNSSFRAGGGKQVWDVSVSPRCLLHEAADGLLVEQCDVMFTRLVPCMQ